MECHIRRINIKEAHQVKIKVQFINKIYDSHIFYASNHMALDTKVKLLDNQEINSLAIVMEDSICL